MSTFKEVLNPISGLDPSDVVEVSVRRNSGPDRSILWKEAQKDWFVTDEHGEKVVRGDRGNTTVDATNYSVTESDGETRLLVNSVNTDVEFSTSFQISNSVNNTKVDWNPNDDRLAISYDDSFNNAEVKVYDGGLNLISSVSDPNNNIDEVSWDPSTNRLGVVGGDNNNTYIYDSSLQLVSTLTDASNSTSSLDWNPNDGRLAVASFDNNVYVYDSNLQLTDTLTEAGGAAASVSWNPINNRLAVSASDGTRIYSSDLTTVQNNLTNIGLVDWSPISERLAIGFSDLWIYDSSLSLITTITDNSENIQYVDWNVNNDKLAVGSEDDNLYVYDSNLSLKSTFTEANNDVDGVSWSHVEDNKLAAVSLDGNARIYEPPRSKLTLDGSSVPDTYETTVVNNETGIVEINEGGSNTITSTVGNAPRLIDENAEARIRKVGANTFLVTGDIYKEDGTRFKKEI